ncbi:MAG: PEP-CTERM sorting domain-containing protein [Chlorobia bacterium]|nr:PEP-CTERM sorting domain-containing protein [Fimbriimonadaceae bacterium]
MNKKLLITLPIATMMVAIGHAQIVTVEFDDHTGTNGNSTFLVNYNGSFKTVTATPFNVAVEGTPFVAYCVELDQGSAPPNTDYSAFRQSIRTFLPMPTGDRLAYIYNHHHNAGLTLDQQIAVQVAIWEARYDSTFNLDAGIFRTESLNSTIKSAAQAILTNAAAATIGPFDQGMYYQSQTFQDLMGPVPEPASLVALGLGAAALLRRRKNRK